MPTVMHHLRAIMDLFTSEEQIRCIWQKVSKCVSTNANHAVTLVNIPQDMMVQVMKHKKKIEQDSGSQLICEQRDHTLTMVGKGADILTGFRFLNEQIPSIFSYIPRSSEDIALANSKEISIRPVAEHSKITLCLRWFVGDCQPYQKDQCTFGGLESHSPVICKFFQNNQCTKGNDCQRRHIPTEGGNNPKITLCSRWFVGECQLFQNGRCTEGSHSPEICSFFQIGECKKRTSCQKRHVKTPLMVVVPVVPVVLGACRFGLACHSLKAGGSVCAFQHPPAGDTDISGSDLKQCQWGITCHGYKSKACPFQHSMVTILPNNLESIFPT